MQHKRQPIVFIIDTSGSMRKRVKRELISAFVREVGELVSRTAADGVAYDIAVISSGPDARLLSDFKSAMELSLPIPGGPSPLGKAIDLAFRELWLQLELYGERSLEYEQPLVVAVLGSKPTDLRVGDAIWHETSLMVREQVQGMNAVLFVPVAIDAPGQQFFASLAPTLRIHTLSKVEGVGDFVDTVLASNISALCRHVNGKGASRVPERSAFHREEFPRGFSPRGDEILSRYRSNTPGTSDVPVIMGGSSTGPSHVRRGTPCQDAYAYRTIGPGWVVIGVADGLGSALKSDTGASVAVHAAVQNIQETLQNNPLTGVDLPPIIRVAASSAREAIIARAREEMCEVQDLACTLILAIAHKGGTTIGHIGDGAVVIEAGSALMVASGPGEAEFVNEVIPITSPGWKGAFKITEEEGPVDSIAVFTDGCQRAALKKVEGQLQPFGGFFTPLFGYLRSVSTREEGEQEIHDLLLSRKMNDSSEDDKTLVIGILRNGG